MKVQIQYQFWYCSSFGRYLNTYPGKYKSEVFKSEMENNIMCTQIEHDIELLLFIQSLSNVPEAKGQVGHLAKDEKSSPKPDQQNSVTMWPFKGNFPTLISMVSSVFSVFDWTSLMFPMRCFHSFLMSGCVSFSMKILDKMAFHCKYPSFPAMHSKHPRWRWFIAGVSLRHKVSQAFWRCTQLLPLIALAHYHQMCHLLCQMFGPWMEHSQGCLRPHVFGSVYSYLLLPGVVAGL